MIFKSCVFVCLDRTIRLWYMKALEEKEHKYINIIPLERCTFLTVCCVSGVVGTVVRTSNWIMPLTSSSVLTEREYIHTYVYCSMTDITYTHTHCQCCSGIPVGGKLSTCVQDSKTQGTSHCLRSHRRLPQSLCLSRYFFSVTLSLSLSLVCIG